MIKKTITYTDFNDVEHTEDFFFNLSKKELQVMQLEARGDMVNRLTAIRDSDDPKQLIEVFEDMISRSYGVKSEDGKMFVKSKNITDAFIHHAAYEALFLEMTNNLQFATEFFNGLMPAGMQAEALDIQNGKTPSQIARERSEAAMQGRRSATAKEPVTISKEKELLTVSEEDLVQPEMPREGTDALQGMSPEDIQELARQHVLSQTAVVNSDLQ